MIEASRLIRPPPDSRFDRLRRVKATVAPGANRQPPPHVKPAGDRPAGGGASRRSRLSDEGSISRSGRSPAPCASAQGRQPALLLEPAPCAAGTSLPGCTPASGARRRVLLSAPGCGPLSRNLPPRRANLRTAARWEPGQRWTIPPCRAAPATRDDGTLYGSDPAAAGSLNDAPAVSDVIRRRCGQGRTWASGHPEGGATG